MLGDEDSDAAEGAWLSLPTSVTPGKPLLGLGVAVGDLPAGSCWVSVKVTNLFWSPCAEEKMRDSLDSRNSLVYTITSCS